MNSVDAKASVQAGLDRRKLQRDEREQRLEAYEVDMISGCNAHFQDAKSERARERDRKLEQERQIRLHREMLREQAREDAAYDAVKRYGVACLGIFCLTVFTRLPMWAAIAFTVAGAVFPVVYIIRLYCMED